MTIEKRIVRKILDTIPSAISSRGFGLLASMELGERARRVVNNGFAKIAGLDMDEAEIGDPAGYPSLNALFTRRLKPDARPISSADVVSPVDGRVSLSARISDGAVIEAKGRSYDVATLIGATSCDAWIRDAHVFTIYLSPANYHRIHSPVCGLVTHMSYMPGRLLPVNRLGYLVADDLLPANERLTSIMDAEGGHHAALVKVGATCVGRISVTYDESAHTNGTVFRKPEFRPLDPPRPYAKGDELGCFELGSTVVLFVDADGFVPNPDMVPGTAVRMGEPLGSWK